MSGSAPVWLTIFIDVAPGEWDAAADFWAGAAGATLSAARGERGEFATLVPEEGDPHLRLQRLGSAPSGTHLDLHVADVESVLEHAVELGATLVARPGHAVLRSPAGYPFCLVGEPLAHAAPARSWGDGHRSRVDQLTIDVPQAWLGSEVEFWSALTGWPSRRAEFVRLITPPELPVRILFQRSEGAVRGHLDIATDDRPGEVRRLTGLGAVTSYEGPRWQVLRPPAGPVVCVTDRSPDTGMLL